jgi:hypothetical protein
MFYLLLESVMLGFNHYLAIYTFTTLQIAFSASRQLGPGIKGSSVHTSVYHH